MGEVEDDDKERHNVKTYSTVTQAFTWHCLCYVLSSAAWLLINSFFSWKMYLYILHSLHGRKQTRFIGIKHLYCNQYNVMIIINKKATKFTNLRAVKDLHEDNSRDDRLLRDGSLTSSHRIHSMPPPLVAAIHHNHLPFWVYSEQRGEINV